MTASSLPTPQTTPGKRTRPPIWLILLLVVVGIVLLLFVAIQLVPVKRNNPTTGAAIQWDSPQTQALAERACMDCHSNQTTWPWYSYVAPVSWVIYYDVEAGRARLNFSNLAAGQSGEGPRAQNSDLAFRLGQVLAGDAGGPEGERGRFPEGGFPPQNRNQQGGQNGQRQGEGQGQFPGGFGGFRLAEQLNENLLQRKSMPPAKYTIIHPSSSLTDAERQQLYDGLIKTFALSTSN